MDRARCAIFSVPAFPPSPASTLPTSAFRGLPVHNLLDNMLVQVAPYGLKGYGSSMRSRPACLYNWQSHTHLTNGISGPSLPQGQLAERLPFTPRPNLAVRASVDGDGAGVEAAVLPPLSSDAQVEHERKCEQQLALIQSSSWR